MPVFALQIVNGSIFDSSKLISANIFDMVNFIGSVPNFHENIIHHFFS